MAYDRSLIVNLPDEREYPEALRAQYELMECFSEKADGRTLLARHRESGRMAVVKCYLKGSPLYDHSEPEALKALNAPPLPRFIAEYACEETRCVLREYVPGDPLDKLAKRRAFTDEQIVGIGLDLCGQLEALHGLNPPVIHRDIKPQNVVLCPDGTAVLIDFGISRAVTDGKGDTVVYGTQGFAPPEQYGYAATDCRSDIFSLGMLLQWLRTGEATPPQKPAAPLERAIARCTAFDPGRRFGSVRQVRRALGACLPGARRRSLVLRALAAACALALIALGGWGLYARANQAAVFADPLIEQAARLNLGLADGRSLTKRMLGDVKALYIVAGEAYPDPDSFYPAVNRWYADGSPAWDGTVSLEDARQLPNLEQVCVAAGNLSDLSPLEGLQKLNKVELKHNAVEDLSPLAGMTALTSVGVNDNPLRDLSPLTECPNLAFLDLCSVRSYDPSVIAELGNFDYLDLSNPTDSYNYLSGKSVLSLRLDWTGLTSLDALKDVTRLEDLQISHTAVSDLAGIEVHAGLKRLNIAATPVSDLTPLLALPQLETLIVSEDMLDAVEALGEAPFEVKIEP